MSKIVAFFEFPMTSAQYDAILAEMKKNDQLFDERRPSHVSFQKGPNWCVVDVWNSEEEFKDFAQNNLLPIFQKLGLNPPPPEVYPAYNYMGAKAEELISA
jgi:hypothetical protein